MDDTKMGTQRFPRRTVAVYAGFQTLLIQNLGEFQNFAKFEWFSWNSSQNSQNLEKLMEFQSGSPSTYCRIPMSSIGGVWMFFGMVHTIREQTSLICSCFSCDITSPTVFSVSHKISSHCVKINTG